MKLIHTLFMLICAHALCDYPLQGDFLSRGKNHTSPIPGVPWYQCLAAHCLIHAGAVYLITGSVWAGLMELVAHAVIDHMKCDGVFGFNTDQALHVVCKLTWVTLLGLEIVR